MSIADLGQWLGARFVLSNPGPLGVPTPGRAFNAAW